MAGLMFGGDFHFDVKNQANPNNDRLVFSKGHATPLYFSLFLGAGQITPEEILKLRKFDSPLEGHPTARFKFAEAATGSLGQGLSIGVGLALGQKKLNPKSEIRNSKTPRVYVLLGDGEMAEGSVWEAANLASYYKLNNLTAIVDVNRLGQSQETMLGWDLEAYKARFAAFGWKTIVINGHDLGEIEKAYKKIQYPISNIQYPTVVIAKTIKGKGVSFLENKEGWHGKPLKKDELDKALKELGDVDLKIRGEVGKPEIKQSTPNIQYPIIKSEKLIYKLGEEVATRKAYGNALARLGNKFPEVVSLDAEVKNSTYAEVFKGSYPERFFEMFIAEQNMAGVSVGLSRLGFIPFSSTLRS